MAPQTETYDRDVRVEFSKHDRNGRQTVYWIALRGKRRVVPGTTMAVGRDLPHDLAHYVIEAATQYENGFWGLVEKGATFKSTGRKRTKPGRAVIAAHHDELINAEALASRHLKCWREGDKSSVTEALECALDQWRELGPNERMVFEWPSSVGCVRGTRLLRTYARA
jgi:hypothetical protein